MLHFMLQELVEVTLILSPWWSRPDLFYSYMGTLTAQDRSRLKVGNCSCYCNFITVVIIAYLEKQHQQQQQQQQKMLKLSLSGKQQVKVCLSFVIL